MEPEKINLEWNIINPINLNHSFFTEIEKEELEHWFNKELRENMGGNIGIHNQTMSSKLNKIFSDFMETIYGELELDFNYDGTFTSDDLYNVKSVKDKEDDSFGYFQFDNHELTFWFYYECSKPKTFKGMFGNGWNKLLLKYLKKRFPELHIVRIGW